MENCNEILTQKFVTGMNQRDQLFLKDSIIKSLKKYRKIDDEYHIRALKMYEFLKNTIVTEEPCSFHGLTWENDSCYMDSVLMCLVAVPDVFIDNFLTSDKIQKTFFCKTSEKENTAIVSQIKKEILNIRKFIREGSGSGNGKKCTMLRKIFNECDSLKIFIEKEQDAGEFLTMLFGVFDELDVCVRREEKYSTTDEDTPMKELDVSEMQQVDTYMSNHNTNPNQYVENYIIEGNDSEAFFRISDFLFKFNERKYKVNNKNIRIIAIEKIISTPYLVFNIQRLGVRDVVSKKIIIPDEIIYIGDDSILEFTGVVIYHNRHYTCFFSCRKIWYFFNDIAPPSEKIKKIGPYNKLMEKAGEVITQKGTIYFYSKMFENMA